MVIAFYFGGRWFTPWKKAELLRMLGKNNLEVAFVRSGSGQLTPSVVSRAEMPIFDPNKNETYVPNNDVTNYIGSVRVHVFNDTDINELDLSRSKPVGEDKTPVLVRDPKQLNAYIKIVKAFYRAMYDRRAEMLLYLVIAALAAGAASSYLSWQNGEAIKSIQPQLAFVADALNRSGGVVLKNLAAGG
jgi:lipopolysaccharide export LptBFGC system permease protein LptF